MPREDGQDGETDLSMEGTDGRQEEAEARFPALTDRAFYNLVTAGPWMRFIGIVTFVACGIMLVCGLFMIFGSDRLYNLPLGSITGLIYVVLAAVCFFPARYSFLAGSRLDALRFGDDAGNLEDALRNNKAYWKFSGILTIVCLSLTVLLLIIAVIAVVVA